MSWRPSNAPPEQRGGHAALWGRKSGGAYWVHTPNDADEETAKAALQRKSCGGALHRHPPDVDCTERWADCEWVYPLPLPTTMDPGTNGCPRFRVYQHEAGVISHVCNCGWYNNGTDRATSQKEAALHASQMIGIAMGVRPQDVADQFPELYRDAVERLGGEGTP